MTRQQLGLDRPKVVFLLGDFVRDGAVRQAFLLARELRQRHGINVEAWSLWEGETAQQFESAGIPTRILRFRRPQCPVRIVRFSYWIARLLTVSRSLREGGIDVLLACGSWPNVISGLTRRWSRIPVIVWCERSFRRARGERIAVRNYRWFIANSESGLSYLTSELGVERGRVTVIPNAVAEPDRESRTDWRTRFGLGPDQPLVSMAATIDRARDHATLLRAWKIIQDCWPDARRPILALAGSFGDAHAECRKLIQSLGLAPSVRFLGPIHDVSSLFQSSDLAVFSSPKEGMPNGVLEAMAEGKAVIASDLPGIRSALGPDSEAALVPPGDAGALARCIQEFLHDKAKCDAAGAANLSRARREFAVERIADEYIRFIGQVWPAILSATSRNVAPPFCSGARTGIVSE